MVQIPPRILAHYSDNLHKLEYLVDAGEIIINNMSAGNELKITLNPPNILRLYKSCPDHNKVVILFYHVHLDT